MAVIAEAVRHLLAAGVTGDALVTAIEDMENAIQPTRSKGALRTAKWRERRNNASQNVTCDDSDECDGDNSPLDSFPTPLPLSPSKTPKGVKSSPKFDEFWRQYPLKKGKDAAMKAYLKATIRADHERIMAGLRKFTQNGDISDPKFIKHPASWLNAGCWEDEYQNKSPPGGIKFAGYVPLGAGG